MVGVSNGIRCGRSRVCTGLGVSHGSHLLLCVISHRVSPHAIMTIGLVSHDVFDVADPDIDICVAERSVTR